MEYSLSHYACSCYNFISELTCYFGIQFMIHYCDLFMGYSLLIDHNLSVQCRLISTWFLLPKTSQECKLVWHHKITSRSNPWPSECLPRMKCTPQQCKTQSWIMEPFRSPSNLNQLRAKIDWTRFKCLWIFQKSEQLSFSAGFPDQFNWHIEYSCQSSKDIWCWEFF